MRRLLLGLGVRMLDRNALVSVILVWGYNESYFFFHLQIEDFYRLPTRAKNYLKSYHEHWSIKNKKLSISLGSLLFFVGSFVRETPNLNAHIKLMNDL